MSIGCCGLRPGIKLARGVPGPSPKYFRRVTQRVTVAVRRRCTASSQVRPRWDQAFPCCSLPGSVAALAGRALRRLVASRPWGPGAASCCPSEVGGAKVWTKNRAAEFSQVTRMYSGLSHPGLGRGCSNADQSPSQVRDWPSVTLSDMRRAELLWSSARCGAMLVVKEQLRKAACRRARRRRPSALV